MDTNTDSTSAIIDITNTPCTSGITNSDTDVNILKVLCENTFNIGNIVIKEKLCINTATNSLKLFKNDIELTADITDFIKHAYVYNNEYWAYKDKDDFVHLFKDKDELTKNIKTLGVLQHPQTGQWLYANDKNKLVLLQ